MKISDVTVQNLAAYLRLDDPTLEETTELTAMKDSAVQYIISYTGLEEAELDDHEDLTQALMVLVADMFDNRNLQPEKAAHINRMVVSILSLHSRNLL